MVIRPLRINFIERQVQIPSSAYRHRHRHRHTHTHTPYIYQVLYANTHTHTRTHAHTQCISSATTPVESLRKESLFTGGGPPPGKSVHGRSPTPECSTKERLLGHTIAGGSHILCHGGMDLDNVVSRLAYLDVVEFTDRLHVRQGWVHIFFLMRVC